jgi:two-component system sensor histidine kinase UhpB
VLLTRATPPPASRLTWALALVIVALQLALSACLYWVNFLTEDIPGRRIAEVLAAESPTLGYVALPAEAFTQATIPREECCETNAIIYRSQLTAADASARYPAVLIISAHDNALVYVDGQIVGGLGRAEGPAPLMGRRPLLVRIPASLAHENATLDIVVQRAVGFGHLRPFHVGDYDRLYPSYLMLRLLRADLPFVNAVIGAFVAAFCFCAAPLFGARALLFSLGGLAAAWAGQHVGLMLTEPPWGANANNGVYLVSFLATLVCTAWFFVEWTSVFGRARPKRHPMLALALDPWDWRARRWLALASAAIMIVGAALIAWRLSFDPMISAQDVNRLVGRFGLLVMTFCLVRIIAFYMRTGFREPIEASAFTFVILAAIADIAMVQFLGTYGVFLGAAVTFFPLALLLSLAVRARGVFEAATTTAEKLNLLVAEREREILDNLEDARRHERAAMLLEERGRIMRDMHDGIGGQLLGLILQARSRKLSDDALVGGLEQSLDDLRLMVDSLEQGEGSLTGALGAFRARIEPRCEAAHVELDWAIEDVGDTPHIGPDKTLQIYRILLEACTNALKHSGARRISVSLRRAGEARIEIALGDDGRGFDAQARTSGRGLTNMRTRANRIGAAFEVQAGAQGSRVVLTLDA